MHGAVGPLESTHLLPRPLPLQGLHSQLLSHCSQEQLFLFQGTGLAMTALLVLRAALRYAAHVKMRRDAPSCCAALLIVASHVARIWLMARACPFGLTPPLLGICSTTYTPTNVRAFSLRWLHYVGVAGVCGARTLHCGVCVRPPHIISLRPGPPPSPLPLIVPPTPPSLLEH